MAVYAGALIVVVSAGGFTELHDHVSLAVGFTDIVLILLISILSLGGIPPILGFYAKLLIVGFMLHNSALAGVGSLVVSSIVLTYAYLRLVHRLPAMQSSVTTNWRSGARFRVALILLVGMTPAILVLCAGAQHRKV